MSSVENKVHSGLVAEKPPALLGQEVKKLHGGRGRSEIVPSIRVGMLVRNMICSFICLTLLDQGRDQARFILEFPEQCLTLGRHWLNE